MCPCWGGGGSALILIWLGATTPVIIHQSASKSSHPSRSSDTPFFSSPPPAPPPSAPGACCPISNTARTSPWRSPSMLGNHGQRRFLNLRSTMYDRSREAHLRIRTRCPTHARWKEAGRSLEAPRTEMTCSCLLKGTTGSVMEHAISWDGDTVRRVNVSIR